MGWCPHGSEQWARPHNHQADNQPLKSTHPENGNPDAHALPEGEDEPCHGVDDEDQGVEARGDPVGEAAHQHLKYVCI